MNRYTVAFRNNHSGSLAIEADKINVDSDWTVFNQHVDSKPDRILLRVASCEILYVKTTFVD